MLGRTTKYGRAACVTRLAITIMLDSRRIYERLRTFRANRESGNRLHEAPAGFSARRRPPLPTLAVQPTR